MSTIPTTEVLIFDTSETHRKDVSAIIHPSFDLVYKADGCLRPGYFGVQTEDTTTGYIFINWESLGHHQTLINGPDYPHLLETLSPVFGGKTQMHHVIFNDKSIAFDSPVTEVVITTLKDPSNRAEVFGILTKISAMTEKKLVFGSTLEDENVIIVVGGWPTVEAHLETVAKPEPKALVERLFVLSTTNHLFHTSLSKYEGK